MTKHPLSLVLIAACLLLAAAGCQTTAKKPPAPAPAADYAKMPAEELEKTGDGLVARQGQAEEAIAMYARALAKGGDPARLKYKQGFVLLREGQWTLAAERFEEALALAPQDVQILQGSAYAAFRLGDYAKAESRLSRAVAVRPDLPGAHNLLGITHNYLKRPELAAADFKAAIALSGPSPDLQNNLGIAYFMQRDYAHAEESFRQALATGPNPKAANNLGLALCGQKKFDAAFEAFKRAGGEAAAHNNIGVCYADAGLKDKAVESFNKAVELSPKYYAAAERNLNQAGGRDTALETMAMQAFPAGEIAAPEKPAQRPIVEGQSPKAAKDEAPADSGISPPEAAKPRDWPEHAPLRAKAQDQSAAATRPAAQAAEAAPRQEQAPDAAEAGQSRQTPSPDTVGQVAASAADSAKQTPPADPKAAAQPEAQSAPETLAASSKGGRVVNIAAVESPAGYRVYITTSAPVQKAQVFSKKSPPAVGIDLYGPWTAPAQTALPGGEGFADKVRIGTHPDKLRVMIDLKNDQIPRKATMETLKNGVVIIVGK
ncbi:MAG: tetratricopeptide repeat protein [Desulfovibrionaceae bacterium]|nr:tetratricopeptide repeat protein [Desulfovibrionaceae bacterium]MBF0512889.1 tetratricopeptide repeat protein [Desulfovibrionaceae bacterium]